MAHKLKIANPQHQMTHIYNVSAHVGTKRSCPNLNDDVMLVQFLLREVVPKLEGNRVIHELPSVNGRMDAITAYWIYHCQGSNEPSLKVDGVVSPAKGLTYGSKAWLIAALNFQYKKHYPDKFDKLPDHHEFSPTLRASLKA